MSSDVTPTLTCTGVDDRTDLDALSRLASPGIEFAALLTWDPCNRPRYPSVRTIEALIDRLGPGVAIHVCGSGARTGLLSGGYNALLSQVGRIQINGSITGEELLALGARFPKQILITQHGPNPYEVVDLSHPSHALLVDGSGGRGILPAIWHRPDTGKPVGFAGGLSPDNLAEQLPLIREASRGGWWVDLESGLRTDDWFDLGRVARAMEAVDAFRAADHG